MRFSVLVLCFALFWDMYFGYIHSYLILSREIEERYLIYIQFTEAS